MTGLFDDAVVRPVWFRQIKRLHLGLSILMAAQISWAATAVLPLKVSGLYSDLAYNAEGGDLLGMELLVIPAGKDNNGLLWNAFFQLAEGDAPYCTLVSLLVRGNKVEFTLPPRGALGGLHFTGTLSSTEMVITTPAGQVEHLRRGNSYWQGT